MEFTLDATSKNARACTIKTNHSTIKTPVFMPVGTLGSVKSLDMDDVLNLLGAEIILANTYHMYLRPGDKTVAKMGKLHNFTKFPKSFLTDSGGFQAFSLSDISKPKENGIEFRSHIDGSKHFISHEKAMEIQMALGSDIAMAFDECDPYPSGKYYVETAAQRTIQWAKKCKEAHHSPSQSLFGIVQGGAFEDLRIAIAIK